MPGSICLWAAAAVSEVPRPLISRHSACPSAQLQVQPGEAVVMIRGPGLALLKAHWTSPASLKNEPSTSRICLSNALRASGRSFPATTAWPGFFDQQFQQRRIQEAVGIGERAPADPFDVQFFLHPGEPLKSSIVRRLLITGLKNASSRTVRTSSCSSRLGWRWARRSFCRSLSNPPTCLRPASSCSLGEAGRFGRPRFRGESVFFAPIAPLNHPCGRHGSTFNYILGSRTVLFWSRESFGIYYFRLERNLNDRRYN